MLVCLSKRYCPAEESWVEPKPKTIQAKVEIKPSKDENVKIRPLSFDEVFKIVSNSTHVDGQEIVRWMQLGAAVNYIAIQSSTNYYGSIIHNCGDGYIPGVSVDEWKIMPATGDEVKRSGYIPIINSKNSKTYKVEAFIRVWLPGRNTMLFNIHNWALQHLDLLLKWRSYANLPLTEDSQYPINTIKTANGQYYSIPFVATYYSRRLFVHRFYMKLSTECDVNPYLIVTDYSRSRIYRINLGNLKGGKSYKIIVTAVDIPKQGVVEVYSDGSPKGITLTYMSSGIF